MRKTTAVLFDLDDTLVDYQSALKAALAAVYRACDVRQADLAAACRAYNTAVAVFSPNVAGNQLSCVEVMRRRLAAVLSLDGIAVSPTDLPALALLFDDASRAHWRPMNGVTTVVRALARNHALGIVSNGWDSLQHDKIDACELTPWFQAIIISQSLGVAKPETRPFQRATELLGVQPHRCVMIGDSWDADVMGARRAGITPLWYTRRTVVEPSKKCVQRLNSFHPPRTALRVITRCLEASVARPVY